MPVGPHSATSPDIPVPPRPRKHPVPAPVERRPRHLAVQRAPEPHPSPLRSIELICPPHPAEMPPQRLGRRCREHRDTRPPPLRLPHPDLCPLAVELLDPQLERL